MDGIIMRFVKWNEMKGGKGKVGESKIGQKEW